MVDPGFPLLFAPDRTCPACGAPATVQAMATPERLAWLRVTVPSAERALVGWPAIQATLAAWGLVTRERYAPCIATLDRWRLERRFPVALLPRGPVWTTTVALTAWLLGPSYHALSGRAPDGTFWPPTGTGRLPKVDREAVAGRRPWRPRAPSVSPPSGAPGDPSGSAP